MVYVEFVETTDITTISNLIRSLDMVTVVNNRSDKEDLKPRGYLLVKIITTKPGRESFNYLASIALKKTQSYLKLWLLELIYKPQTQTLVRTLTDPLALLSSVMTLKILN